MRLLRIEHHIQGDRLWLMDTWRIHGYAVGVFLLGAGVALIVHDWHDRFDAVRFR